MNFENEARKKRNAERRRKKKAKEEEVDSEDPGPDEL